MMMMMMLGICSDISTKLMADFIRCYLMGFEFGSVGFCGGRKTGEQALVGGECSLRGTKGRLLKT